jgi:hypothetical protein
MEELSHYVDNFTILLYFDGQTDHSNDKCPKKKFDNRRLSADLI